MYRKCPALRAASTILVTVEWMQANALISNFQ